jgi:hypothetical protein
MKFFFAPLRFFASLRETNLMACREFADEGE